jgi:hypothetical protein
MTSNEKTQNYKVVDLDNIYKLYIYIIFSLNFIQKIYYLTICLRKNIFYTKSNKNIFYINIVDLDEIYDFLVLSFFI